MNTTIHPSIFSVLGRTRPSSTVEQQTAGIFLCPKTKKAPQTQDPEDTFGQSEHEISMPTREEILSSYRKVIRDVTGNDPEKIKHLEEQLRKIMEVQKPSTKQQ